MHFMSPKIFHVAEKMISCRRKNFMSPKHDFMSPKKFHVAGKSDFMSGK